MFARSVLAGLRFVPPGSVSGFKLLAKMLLLLHVLAALSSSEEGESHNMAASVPVAPKLAYVVCMQMSLKPGSMKRPGRAREGHPKARSRKQDSRGDTTSPGLNPKEDWSDSTIVFSSSTCFDDRAMEPRPTREVATAGESATAATRKIAAEQSKSKFTSQNP